MTRRHNVDVRRRSTLLGSAGAAASETLGLPVGAAAGGTGEIREFRSEGRGSMMGMVMPHSMHVHGLQFRALERSVSSTFADVCASVSKGFVDTGWMNTGWKDTGLLRNCRVQAA